MQVFISQPMAGMNELEVYAIRNKVCEKFDIQEGELIENYKKDVPTEDVNTNVWCLGDSIRSMAFANLVIFAPGWEEARGCLIEHDICADYGISFIEMESSRKTMNKVRDCQFYSKLSSSRCS